MITLTKTDFVDEDFKFKHKIEVVVDAEAMQDLAIRNLDDDYVNNILVELFKQMVFEGAKQISYKEVD